MKFRGLMTDYNAMKEFMNIINCLSKLSKECVIRIAPDKLYFIISEDDHGPRKPFIWCELQSKYYFREYTMCGVSDDANEIYLSLSPVMLAKSISTIKMGAKYLKVKLTNKQTPCLTLETSMTVNDMTMDRQCVHDVPVEVITTKYWADYNEPKFQEFHVTLQLPAIKSVRCIIERMKNLSHYLIVSANKSGRVTLKTEGTLANVSVHFPHLLIHSFAENINFGYTSVNLEETTSPLVTATIDIKKACTFLTALPSFNYKIICSIVNEKMVKLSLQNEENIKLQCFLTEITP